MPRRKPTRRTSDSQRLAEASRAAEADRRYARYLKQRRDRERAGASLMLSRENAPTQKKRVTITTRKAFLAKQVKEDGQVTVSNRYAVTTTSPVRRIDDPCRRRQQRRAVLLAIGRVNKPGGAPGPYRRTATSKDPCK